MQLLRLLVEKRFKNESEIVYSIFFQTTPTPQEEKDFFKKMENIKKLHGKKTILNSLILQRHKINDTIMKSSILLNIDRNGKNYYEIYEKMPNKKIEARKKAIERIAKKYNKKNDGYFYYLKEEYMSTQYHYGTQFVDYYSEEEKTKMLKKRISALKGSLTKSINQAKKIRMSYKDTLFPDEYKTDEKFCKKIKLIILKKNKLKIEKKRKSSEMYSFSTKLSEIDEEKILKLVTY